MPTRESDSGCNSKKMHIGNDFVTIVYNDSQQTVKFGTIKVTYLQKKCLTGFSSFLLTSGSLPSVFLSEKPPLVRSSFVPLVRWLEHLPFILLACLFFLSYVLILCFFYLTVLQSGIMQGCLQLRYNLDYTRNRRRDLTMQCLFIHS